ncbi:hypothetical protein T484DRAFT_1912437, partial [Baffinella frigidus]
MGKTAKKDRQGFVGLQAQDSQLQAVRDLGADADGSDDDEEDAAAHMERRRGALKLLAFILVLLIIVPNIAKALAGEDAETFASLQCRKAGDRNDIHLELDADGNCVFAGMLPSAINGKSPRTAGGRKGALGALAEEGLDEIGSDGSEAGGEDSAAGSGAKHEAGGGQA